MVTELNGLDEVKKYLKTDKLILGKERTLKALNNKLLSRIFLASNVQPKVSEDMEYYCKLSNVDLVKLEIPNDELGIVCKKPFSVSIIGLVK